MSIHVLDTGSSQGGLDFDCAADAGWSSTYVKLGGDNSGRYVSPHYRDEVDRARAAGMILGHYWVPCNGADPTSAADYFVDNLERWSPADYVVLDNEALDGCGRYSDAQAAVWIGRVQSRLGISGKQIKHYAGLADARGSTWTNVLGTGAQFIIAAYDYSPGTFPAIDTVPTDRIDGHQYSSSEQVCGVTVDRNAFRDTAFDYSGGGTPGTGNEEEEMSFINITGKAGARRGGYYAVFALGGGAYTAVFIGQGGPKDLQAVSDEGQIAQLQQRISGLA